MEQDHDKVMDRMYSIAKDRAKLMTRESYQSIEDSKEMSRMIAMAQYEAKRKEEEWTQSQDIIEEEYMRVKDSEILYVNCFVVEANY